MNLLQHSWNIVFLCGFIAYATIRQVFERRAKGNEKVVSRFDALEKILLGFLSLGIFFLPVLYFFTHVLDFANYRVSALFPWTGCAIMLASLWLFWRSHADLGVNWSMSLEMRRGHQLIRHGVYRSIRHPMYASVWLWGIAQALMLQNWIAGPSTLVTFAALYFFRVPREEKMLRDWFGVDYPEYMRQTRRVFPKMLGR